MRILRYRALLAAVMAAGLLAGCGSADNDPEARQQQMQAYADKHGLDVDVDIRGSGADEQVVIKHNAPGMNALTGKNLDIPDDFPKDVPVHPGISVHAVNSMGVGYMLQGTTREDVQTIQAFYKEKMPAEGWTALAAQPNPVMTRLGFSKGKRNATVTLMAAQGESPTTIQIGVVTRPGG